MTLTNRTLLTAFAAGVASAVAVHTARRLLAAVGDRNPAAEAGRDFYRAALAGAEGVRMHPMRTLESERTRPFFGAWAATVRTASPETRTLAEAAAQKHRVRLLTYTAQDGIGETYVFVS